VHRRNVLKIVEDKDEMVGNIMKELEEEVIKVHLPVEDNLWFIPELHRVHAYTLVNEWSRAFLSKKDDSNLKGL